MKQTPYKITSKQGLLKEGYALPYNYNNYYTNELTSETAVMINVAVNTINILTEGIELARG